MPPIRSSLGFEIAMCFCRIYEFSETVYSELWYLEEVFSQRSVKAKETSIGISGISFEEMIKLESKIW